MSTRSKRLLAAILTIVMALGLFVPAGAVTFSNVEVEEEAPVLDSPTLDVQEEAAPLAAEMEEQPLAAEEQSAPAELAAAGSFLNAAGMKESAYATWEPASGVSSYTASVIDASGKETALDDSLIRSYPGYMRVDALGLKAGKYKIKVTPNTGAAMTTEELTVTAYDRSGYAFENSHTPGAYNADGTLKANAKVVYITKDTASTVKLGVDVNGKGTDTEVTGLPGILDAYKKKNETDPLCIRVIGTVANDYQGNLPGYTGAEITGTNHEGAATSLNNSDYKGDIAFKDCMAPVTIEGVGCDAVLYGIGLRFTRANDVEVRNLGFMNCNSDEADSIGFQPSCTYVWVHNNDIFYGMKAGDADQAKGDGALDTKGVKYATLSYNHFWDSGKANLCGLGNNMDYMTYHHNWYDHSDSRHPRVRYTAHCHVYNNYYDDNAKYGVGGTTGSSIFVENNYFRNCKHPVLISMQGTDEKGGGTFSGENGGMIKMFGNVIIGGEAVVSHTQSATDFDAYVATSKSEKVPASYVTKKGGTTYNNFDTESGFYTYKLDAADDVPTVVKAQAGRQGGSDFDYQIADGSDNYVGGHIQPIATLATAINNYKSALVRVGGSVDGSSSGEHTHVTSWRTKVAPSCNKDTQALVPGVEEEYCTICNQTTGRTREVPGQHTDANGDSTCDVCGADVGSGGGGGGGTVIPSGNTHAMKAGDFTMTNVTNSGKDSLFVGNEVEDATENYFHVVGTVKKRNGNGGSTEGTKAEFFEMPKNDTDGIKFTVTNVPAKVVVSWGSPKKTDEQKAILVIKQGGTVLSTEEKGGKEGTNTTTVDLETAGEYLVTSGAGTGAARVVSVTVTEPGSTQPSSQPSAQPSSQPSTQPSTTPSAQPSAPAKVDKTALDKAIADATAAKLGVVTSVDGKDVDKTVYWVNAVQLRAINNAITTAEGVSSNAAATQDAVNSAASALTAALNVFKGQKALGTKETVVSGTPYTLVIDDVVAKLGSNPPAGWTTTSITLGADPLTGQGTQGFFTLYAKDKGTSGSQFKASKKTFTDGALNKQFNPGGAVSLGETKDKPVNAIGFTTTGAATVKVWWVGGKSSETRHMAILDATGTEVAVSNEGSTGDATISTMELTAEGTYYLGGKENNNNVYKVEVTVSGGETPAVIDKTALNKAIQDAAAAKLGVVTSADGKDVDKTVYWITAAQLKTLNDAITAAETVAATASPTQDAVDKAAEDLTAVVTAFTAQKALGTKDDTVTQPSAQPSSAPSVQPSTQPGGVKVTGVTIQNGATASVAMGKTLTLTAEATVTGSGATDADKAVTWSSGKETVATVKDGVVTPVGVGTAEIVATSVKDSTKSAKLTLTVTKGDVTLSIRARNEGVAADGGTILFEVEGVPAGAQAQVTIAPTTGGAKVEACDENGWNYKATLPANTSDKDDVAYEVTAAFAGDANWNAATAVKTTVYVRHVGAKVISLTKVPGGGTGKLEFTEGDKMELTVEAKVAPAGELKYAWSKDGTAIAGATSATYAKEKVTAADAGVYTCRVSCEGAVQDREVKVTVTVKTKGGVAVESVKLDRTTASIRVNGTFTLIATVSPDNATNKSVNWTSSNTQVATVDQTGKVIGVTAGTATITVTTVDGGKSATCALTVSASSGGGGGGGGGSTGGGGGGGGSTGGGGGSTGGSGSAGSDLPFIDVAPKAWFHDAVKRAYDKGLMKGSDATHFAPNDATTRAMVATVLFRLDGEKKASVSQLFADVISGQWYTDAVAWAAEKGIVKGYEDGSFGPNDNVTREQLAAMLYRYAAPAAKSDKDLSTFADAASISDWATEAITWAVDKGIITGKTGGLLDPQGLASRAEICTMLVRFMDLK